MSGRRISWGRGQGAVIAALLDAYDLGKLAAGGVLALGALAIEPIAFRVGAHGFLCHSGVIMRSRRPVSTRASRTLRSTVRALSFYRRSRTAFTRQKPAVWPGRFAHARVENASPPTNRCGAARSARSRGCCRTRAPE